MEGEDCDHEGSEREDVSDENEEDPDPLGPSISRLPMAFSVRFNAFSTISMVHTLWWREGEPVLVDRFKLSSRSESSSELGKEDGGGAVLFRLTMLRSSSWRLQSCLPVEKERRCCCCCCGGGLPPDEAEDVEARCKLSVSERLLARNSCSEETIGGCCCCDCFRGSSLVRAPELLFTK